MFFFHLSFAAQPESLPLQSLFRQLEIMQSPAHSSNSLTAYCHSVDQIDISDRNETIVDLARQKELGDFQPGLNGNDSLDLCSFPTPSLPPLPSPSAVTMGQSNIVCMWLCDIAS